MRHVLVALLEDKMERERQFRRPGSDGFAATTARQTASSGVPAKTFDATVPMRFIISRQRAGVRYPFWDGEISQFRFNTTPATPVSTKELRADTR